MESAIKITLILSLFTALLVNGTFVILEKYNLIDKAHAYAPNKLIRKLFSCYFCLQHHASLIIGLPIFLLDGFQYIDLIIPFCSASLINLFQN